MTAWPPARLRYVARINPPVRADLLARPNLEVTFLPMEAIGEDGSLQLERTRPVEEVRSGYTSFEDGDVAFAKVTPCFENGKGALMRGLTEGAGFGTSELTVLRPNPGTSARFLSYVVQSELFRQHGVGAMTGAGGLKRVPDDFTRNFQTPWPRHGDQERIANFLDAQTARIDALIAEKEQLTEKLEEWRLSTINHALSKGLKCCNLALTGDAWFPEIPADWAYCALNYRYEVELGKMLDEKRQTGASPMPYLRNVDVRWDYVNPDALPTMDVAPEERDRYSVWTGDLLVCEGGVGVGRSALWTGPGGVVAYQKALHRVRPRSASDVPRYLLYLMQDAVWRGRVLGNEKATIPHLPAEAFRRWRFPFPPNDQQRQILRHLDNCAARARELTIHCREHIERLREYRSSLISAAVTGQLDISTFQPAEAA